MNNAIPETPEGGRIAVATSWVEEGSFPEGGYVQVVVADTGRGMAEEVRSRLFTDRAALNQAGRDGTRDPNREAGG
ncbi:MAG: ATP-binding protein [Armatimonadota bacterium]